MTTTTLDLPSTFNYIQKRFYFHIDRIEALGGEATYHS